MFVCRIPTNKGGNNSLLPTEETGNEQILHQILGSNKESGLLLS